MATLRASEQPGLSVVRLGGNDVAACVVRNSRDAVLQSTLGGNNDAFVVKLVPAR